MDAYEEYFNSLPKGAEVMTEAEFNTVMRGYDEKEQAQAASSDN